MDVLKQAFPITYFDNLSLRSQRIPGNQAQDVILNLCSLMHSAIYGYPS